VKVGADMATIVLASRALKEDAIAEVKRLRAAGYIRVYGDTRSRRYFWRP
jgi:hypothetical protein